MHTRTPPLSAAIAATFAGTLEMAGVDPKGRANSWYAATANPCESYPALRGDRQHQVAVIGAGVTGLNTAIELAERGIDVAVLEAEEVGWGASGRNGGQVVTGFIKSLNALSKLVGKEDTKRLWGMAEEGKRLIQRRIQAYNIACGYRPGYMYTAVKPSHETWLKELLDSWNAYGYEGARWIGPEETRSLVDCPYYRGGIFDIKSGHLHPLNYVRGLGHAAVRAGATIYERSPAIELRHGAKLVIKTPKGAVTADFAVLAGNALLGPISSGVARIINPQIAAVSTYIIATEPMDPARAATIVPGDIAVSDIMYVVNYYRRSHDHRILFGGGLDWSGLARGNVAARMHTAMEKWLPRSKDLRIDYCWGGYVDMTMNRLPSLGRLASNIFYAHGFSGNGLTLTGIAGRVIAEAVAGTASRFEVFARIPHRPFPGGPLLRQPIAVLGALWYKMKDLLP
ncbi:MAG TPA: FAD-dependent oxidoreductase [Alphaproteobacteria bacterium]|nr:FAD-dependent oxidoreductase [Alphaproteobacteria bacterium]